MNLNDAFDQQTYREVLKWASYFLENNRLEVGAAEWLMRERLGWSKTDLVRHLNTTISLNHYQQFKNDIIQYVNGEPVQYIVGHEWFYGRQFKVTPETLIPRPETEEWFDRMLSSLAERTLRVVDIGTGTGVLGISQKLERPQDFVTVTDISHSVIDVAKENAGYLKADIDFKVGDLFDPFKQEAFDLILFNPPYISKEEWKEMDQSVIEYEPHLALFAKENGLEVYNRLAKELPKVLKTNGEIFMEIGYKQGATVKEIFYKAFPYDKIEIWQDFSGHDRVVYVKK